MNGLHPQSNPHSQKKYWVIQSAVKKSDTGKKKTKKNADLGHICLLCEHSLNISESLEMTNETVEEEQINLKEQRWKIQVLLLFLMPDHPDNSKALNNHFVFSVFLNYSVIVF